MNPKLIKNAFLPFVVTALTLLDGSAVRQGPDGYLRYQSSYTAQASDEASIRDVMVNTLTSEAVADRFIQDLSIPPSHEGVYREHLTKTWNNKLIRDAFVDEVMAILPALRQDTLADTRELIIAYSASWFQEKAMNGLQRLDASDLKINIRFAEGLLEYLPPSTCKAVLFDEASASEVIQYEVSYMVTLPKQDVRAYLNTMRAALVAELNDYPAVQPLSASQRQIAQAVLDERLMATLEYHPNGPEILAGFDSLNALSDEAVCSLTAMIMHVAATEEGAVGNWLMRYVLE